MSNILVELHPVTSVGSMVLAVTAIVIPTGVDGIPAASWV